MSVAARGPALPLPTSGSRFHWALVGLIRDRAVRAGQDVVRVLERAHLTVAFVLALAVTTATQAGARSRGATLMTLTASTNLHNLAAHPLDVLFVSAFWVETPALFWPMVAALAVVLGLAERRLGRIRTLLVFAAGHLGATLSTVAGIALGVARGWLPVTLTHVVDVGPSYGLVAVVAVLAATASTPRRRLGLLAVLLAGLTAALVVDGGFTDVGHIVAAVIGVAMAPLPIRIYGSAPRVPG